MILLEHRKIPIIKLGTNLLISIQIELDDQLALALQDDIMYEIVRIGATGVIIDVSGLEIMDSYIARIINDVGKNAQIMGAKAVLTGLQPAVAITLIEMGMELENVETALNLEAGLQKLNWDGWVGSSNTKQVDHSDNGD